MAYNNEGGFIMKVYVVHFTGFTSVYQDLYPEGQGAIRAVCSTLSIARQVMERKVRNLCHHAHLSVTDLVRPNKNKVVVPSTMQGFYISSHTIDATGAYTPAGRARRGYEV
jgi:hypothetical protein